MSVDVEKTTQTLIANGTVESGMQVERNGEGGRDEEAREGEGGGGEGGGGGEEERSKVEGQRDVERGGTGEEGEGESETQTSTAMKANGTIASGVSGGPGHRRGKSAGSLGMKSPVCVTVSCGDKEGITMGVPNGKPASATLPRALRHGHSFSSTHSNGRNSPYGSESHPSSSSSDLASLSHDLSFSSSQQALLVPAIVEQLKEELLQHRSEGHQASGDRRRGGGGEEDAELTKTLLEHVVSLKMELATMKEENQKLHSARSNMDNELHELTENLFEEAYKMVDEAKGGKVSAEKRLADAAGKIDAMETEMSALKSIIHSSQPLRSHKSTPNTLHPHTTHSTHQHSSHKHKRSSIRRAVHKIQKKTAGALGHSSPNLKTHQTAPFKVVEHKGDVKGEGLVEGQVDREEYMQFSQWIESLSSSPPPPSPSPSPPSLSYLDNPFMATVLEQDVRPCLTFKNRELSQRVLQAVQDNTVIMESLQLTNSMNRHSRGPSMAEGSKCALSEAMDIECTHRMRLGESPEWLYISQRCRDRVASACDFFMYLNHIQKGIIKADTVKLYWQVARLRALMHLSRLALSLPSDGPSH